MDPSSTTILLVEDEPLTRLMLRRILTRSGFSVAEVASGEAALAWLQQRSCQLIVLDILLPGGMDGFKVCATAKADQPELAIIMLSHLGEVSHRIKGLVAGADDYMAKPFSGEELVARVFAVLRRSRHATTRPEHLAVGTLQMEFHTQKCFKAGRDLDLTPTEFRLLRELCDSRGVALSRRALSGRVWGASHYGSDKSLDVYIRRLRQKVEDDPSAPDLIRTVRGFGYVCN